MGRIAYTKAAVRDVDELWRRIAADWSPRSANRAAFGIEGRCRLLLEFPELGRLRPDLMPDARATSFERWIIVYRIVSAGILVVRVVDGRRDLAQLAWPRH